MMENARQRTLRWYRAAFGGFEDEVLLKAAADPAALNATTKVTPTLPAGAVVEEAYLIMKFRELFCAAANFIDTQGVVQIEKVAAGAWVSGITIEVGMFDVAAGVPGAGDVLIGNIDISGQIASGAQVEFKLITLRTDADDLAIRDVQLAPLIGYTL